MCACVPVWFGSEGVHAHLFPGLFVSVCDFHRKRLVQEGHLSAKDEIRFLDMVLTFPRNCKSSGAWYHR